MKFFEIFKAGNYPQGAFTEADINSLVQHYDPSFCEAPLTLDHTQKGPAYGWVSALKNENGKLKASFRDVTDDLKEFVQAGKYKKISVEIYRDLEGKKPYLKAVSFLGAAIPQVKGMEPIEFKESPSDVYTFERSDLRGTTEGTSPLRCFAATPESSLPADTEMQGIQENIQKLNDSITTFSEQLDKLDKPENKEVIEAKTQIIKLQDKVEDLTSKLSKFQDDALLRQKAEEELTRLRLQMRKTEFEQFLNEQIAFGNLTPSQKDLSIKILMVLDSVPNFEETSDPVDEFRELIKSLPKQVVFEELATKGNQAVSDTDVSQFEDASEESLEIYKEAKALSEKENIAFKDALLKINRSK